ncbi:hypothetical protein X948_3885 [Burkholderia pseudomallei MSHR5608]|nr:hypothetical protein X948_3885 [Burkholderia pseudomallei MSHR5608]
MNSSENARLTMVWPSRRHVTFFSNRPRALNHYNAHFRSEPRNRGMQKSTPPLRGVFLFSVVQTEGANSTALQRADIHALPTAAAPPNTSSNSASIIVHARWSAARL